MKKDSRVRLFEVMRRVVPGFQNEGVNLNSLYGSEAYKKKQKKLKQKLTNCLMKKILKIWIHYTD